jgi:hypothetical protein
LFEDRLFGRSVISAKAKVHRESALIALKVIGAGFQPALATGWPVLIPETQPLRNVCPFFRHIRSPLSRAG